MFHDDCMMTGGSFYGWEPLSVGLSRNGVLLWKINGWVYGCLWMDQPQEPWFQPPNHIFIGMNPELFSRRGLGTKLQTGLWLPMSYYNK